MGMEETKKMLEIIEKQYKESNNNYNKQVKRRKKLEKTAMILIQILWVFCIALFVLGY